MGLRGASRSAVGRRASRVSVRRRWHAVPGLQSTEGRRAPSDVCGLHPAPLIATKGQYLRAAYWARRLIGPLILAAGLDAAGGRATPAMTKARARTTLGDLHRATPWVWLYCNKCQHSAPLACAVAVIRWGSNISSDKPRQCARCTACGHKGATIQRPSWSGEHIGFMPFPVHRLAEAASVGGLVHRDAPGLIAHEQAGG
jgi:hypothetical protein